MLSASSWGLILNVAQEYLTWKSMPMIVRTSKRLIKFEQFQVKYGFFTWLGFRIPQEAPVDVSNVSYFLLIPPPFFYFRCSLIKCLVLDFQKIWSDNFPYDLATVNCVVWSFHNFNSILFSSSSFVNLRLFIYMGIFFIVLIFGVGWERNDFRYWRHELVALRRGYILNRADRHQKGKNEAIWFHFFPCEWKN